MGKRNFRIKRLLKDKEEKPSLLSDAALILGVFTGLSYLIAFSYEKGYKEYYNLNQVFLSDITINNVLISMTALISLVFLLYSTYNAVISNIPNDSSNPVVIAIRYKFLPPVFLIFILMVLNAQEFLILKMCVTAIIIIGLWVFIIYPYICLFKIKGYKNKMSLYVKDIDRQSLTMKIFHLAKLSKPVVIFLLIFITYLATNSASMYGTSQARMQEEYLLVKYNNKDYVVISKYSENYLVAPLNMKEKEIIPNFILIEGKSNLDKPLEFKASYFEDGLKVSKAKRYNN